MKLQCFPWVRTAWMAAAILLAAGCSTVAEPSRTETSMTPPGTPLAGTFKTKHVVILVMDGARYSETWGDPGHRYIPRIAGELAPQGVVFTNFRNQGKTETVPGHTALCTGVYQTKMNNGGKEIPSHPSLLQYLLRQTGAPASQAWINSSKDKLVVLADCTDPEWKGRFRPSTDCGKSGNGKGGYRDDSTTFVRAKEILHRDAPALLVINFKDPDSCGHENKWEAYLGAIRQTDSYAADLWGCIQADSVLRDSTALFIVNDHGRHTRDFKSHGDNCDGCRHILCVALGPDFPRGVVNEEPCGQIDIPATAAQLLGVEMPTGQGHTLPGLVPSLPASPAIAHPKDAPAKATPVSEKRAA